jgi:hypothetical protein
LGLTTGFSQRTLRAKRQPIDQQSLDTAYGWCGWLKTTVSGVSRPKVQPAARLVTVNPAGKQALPRTAGVHGVMPTGFAAANISSKTAGRSERLADRDGFRYGRISLRLQLSSADAVVRRRDAIIGGKGCYHQ